MRIIFSKESWNDYIFWQQTDKKILKRINDLIKDIERTPFQEKGKPEALKYHLSGFWSRRITEEHRVIYTVSGDDLLIASCRYHY